MHEVIYHYESRIKKLVATGVRLERMVVEQNQYFHSTLRLSEDYVSTKADAKLNLSELIRKKYTALTNSEYLDKTFDFYGMSFRLSGHEKKKIAKNLVIK